MPGLGAWARVRDWRVGRIREMANVEIFLDSELTPEDILAFGFRRVILATGAQWRSDGVGRTNWQPIPGSDQGHVVAVESVFSGEGMVDPIVIFDDDNFYLGAVIAEKLRHDGHAVTLVTTAPEVSPWTKHTLEQHRIQARVLELGIEVITAHNVTKVGPSEIEIGCIYTDHPKAVPATTLVMVTSRRPNAGVHRALTEDSNKLAESGITSVVSIGDCCNPSTIAAAVHDGHRVAREMDEVSVDPDMPFRRERILLEA